MLKSPFPYFGGKSRAAALVWPRFGQVRNYVEPFFGSGAMLLARPDPWTGTETVNDADGLLCNFWRALQDDPAEVARWADWPVNENDLHARHAWLVERKERLQAWLEGDPDWYDAQAAGWWVWGMACWIGGGFCSGKGPWAVREVGGHRKLVHLGNAGQGVNRTRVHLGPGGNGMHWKHGDRLIEYFNELAARFEKVRVCCGDWKRVCGPTPTVKQGLTAVFLDPPYGFEVCRDNNCYRVESGTVAHDVRKWAIEHGDDPRMRIAVCGYEGEHTFPRGWTCMPWKATGGYGKQASGRGLANSLRERIWFSKSCLTPAADVRPSRSVSRARAAAAVPAVSVS